VALLTKAAGLLGSAVVPEPVAVQAVNPAVIESGAIGGYGMLGAYDAPAFMAAHGLTEADVLDMAEDGWAGAGHVVVLAKNRSLLLDPTLPQLNVTPLGSNFGAAAIKLRRPVGKGFQHTVVLGEPACSVTYINVPEDQTWREFYDAAVAAADGIASDIVAIYRQALAVGALPEQEVTPG
jgi:hypothetical protein